MENQSSCAINSLARAVQVLQHGVLHFVDAFDLADQQFGIADQLQRLGAVLDGVFQSGDQSLIFGEIVGLVAEVLAERGDFASRIRL